jgi:hypothetical protein
MTPTDEYDKYEPGEDEEGYDAPRPVRRRSTSSRGSRRLETPITQQAFDWGISGSILAILLVTALYVLSPLDLIPDVIPIAGQADDIASVLAGGGSVIFLAVLRYLLRTRIGRWGCLITIVLAAVGAFVMFWVLLQLFGRIV